MKRPISTISLLTWLASIPVLGGGGFSEPWRVLPSTAEGVRFPHAYPFRESGTVLVALIEGPEREGGAVIDERVRLVEWDHEERVARSRFALEREVVVPTSEGVAPPDTLIALQMPTVAAAGSNRVLAWKEAHVHVDPACESAHDCSRETIGRIVMTVSTDGGTIFSAPFPLAPPSDPFVSQATPDLAYLDGELLVTWGEHHRKTGERWIRLQRFTADGEPLGPPILVDDDENRIGALELVGPRLAIDPPTRRVTVVWGSWIGISGYLFARLSEDGGASLGGAPVRISDRDDPTIDHFDVGVARDGTLLLVWGDSRDRVDSNETIWDTDVFYTRARWHHDGGLALSTPVRVNPEDESPPNQFAPRLAVLGGDDPEIVYLEFDPRQPEAPLGVAIVRSTAGGLAWRRVHELGPELAQAGFGLSSTLSRSHAFVPSGHREVVLFFLGQESPGASPDLFELHSVRESRVVEGRGTTAQ